MYIGLHSFVVSSLSSAVTRLRLLLKSSKVISRKKFIIFWRNSSKQEVIRYILRSTNLLILLEIMKNCPSSGRNLLLCSTYLYGR
jgi:hypothetical protein